MKSYELKSQYHYCSKYSNNTQNSLNKSKNNFNIDDQFVANRPTDHNVKNIKFDRKSSYLFKMYYIYE